MKRRLKVVAVNALLILLGMALVELGARLFGVTPESVDPDLALGLLGKEHFGRGNYPQGYFVANEERGFDIAPSFKTTRFDFVDASVDIFSNRYSCFDKNEAYEGPYILLLGDSFTWGYAPYESKWGTQIERDLGMTVAKCGVTHTGQRFQLGKGRDVVGAIGHAPRLVVVGFFVNDPQDDLMFPRATVIEGYLTDQMRMRGGTPQKLSKAELEQRYQEWKSGDGSKKNLGFKTPSFARRTFVVGSLFARLTRELGSSKPSEEAPLTVREDLIDGVLAANHAAISGMRSWAREMSAELLFVLIPTKGQRSSFEMIYAHTKSFLDQEKIGYVDLQAHFKEMPRGGGDLYWKHDLHLTPEGNGVVARIVTEEIRKRYGAALSAP